MDWERVDRSGVTMGELFRTFNDIASWRVIVLEFHGSERSVERPARGLVEEVAGHSWPSLWPVEDTVIQSWLLPWLVGGTVGWS